MKRTQIASFFDEHNDISVEWNYERNGELRPSDFSSNSHKKVWWLCSEGHEYEAIIRKANAERAKKLKPFIEEENKKVENALKDANAYFDAQRIRAYAAAYYEKNSPLFESQPRLKEYYEWLKKRADWLDPLIENDYDRFLSPQ